MLLHFSVSGMAVKYISLLLFAPFALATGDLEAQMRARIKEKARGGVSGGG